MSNRYFQWVAGDRKGEVVIFNDIVSEDDTVYITFKDGSRINESLVGQLNNKDLTGKYMAEIDHPNNCWTFKEEWIGREEERWETNAAGESVCVQPFVPGKKITRLIPPKATPPTHSVFGAINKVVETPVPVDIPIQTPITKQSENTINTNDPVYILMSKAKKQDSDIMMNLTVSLPPKNLYDIAKDSFDSGAQKFVEYIIQNITVDKIKEALKIAITEMYEKSEKPLM